jgi:hypothetical protein
VGLQPGQLGLVGVPLQRPHAREAQGSG